jgi:hypothetical protein
LLIKSGYLRPLLTHPELLSGDTGGNITNGDHLGDFGLGLKCGRPGEAVKRNESRR